MTTKQKKEKCALMLNLAKEQIERAEKALSSVDWQNVMDNSDESGNYADQAYEIAAELRNEEHHGQV